MTLCYFSFVFSVVCVQLYLEHYVRRCCGQARRFEKTTSVAPMHFLLERLRLLSFQLLNHSIELSVPLCQYGAVSSKMVGSPGDLPKWEGLIPGRNQSPGTVENRLTSNSVRSSLVTESSNFVFHFVWAFLCYMFVASIQYN